MNTLNENAILLEQSQTLVAVGSRIADFFKKLKQDLLTQRKPQEDKEQTAEEIVISEIIMMLDTVLKSIHAGFTKEDPNALSKMESINKFFAEVESLLSDYMKKTASLVSRKGSFLRQRFTNNVLNILKPLKAVKDDTKLIDAEKTVIDIMKTFLNKVGHKQSEETDIDEENNAIQMFFPIFKINPVQDFKSLEYVHNQVYNKLKLNPKSQVPEKDVINLKTDQAKELDQKFAKEFIEKYKQQLANTPSPEDQIHLKTNRNSNLIKYTQQRWKEVFYEVWKNMHSDWQQWHNEQIKKERETVGHLTENIPPEIQAFRSQMKDIFEGVE